MVVGGEKGQHRSKYRGMPEIHGVARGVVGPPGAVGPRSLGPRAKAVLAALRLEVRAAPSPCSRLCAGVSESERPGRVRGKDLACGQRGRAAAHAAVRTISTFWRTKSGGCQQLSGAKPGTRSRAQPIRGWGRQGTTSRAHTISVLMGSSLGVEASEGEDVTTVHCHGF